MMLSGNLHSQGWLLLEPEIVEEQVRSAIEAAAAEGMKPSEAMVLAGEALGI